MKKVMGLNTEKQLIDNAEEKKNITKADNPVLTSVFSRQEKSVKFLMTFIVLATGLSVMAFSFIYNFKPEEIIRNSVTGFICGGIIVYMLVDASYRKLFSYDNGQKRNRFVFVYLMSLIVALFLPLIAVEVWPYLFIFLILGLFSTNEIGLFSGSVLLLISVVLEKEGNNYEFFIYFLAGAVILTLLRDLTETTKIGYPVFISLTVLFVLLIAYDVMFQNKTFNAGMIIVPLVNILVNLILMMITLNIFGIYVIRKSNDMYMDINDTEYPLLVKLKETDKKAYFNAIHIAYLAERIALDLGLNARAVKTMSYYYRIGVIDGSKSWNDVKHFYIENNFPEEALVYLKEYIENDRSRQLSKEAAIINMCETLIASLTYLFEKDKDSKIDYDELIDKIFAHKMENRELYNYNISLYELERMKVLMKKEKLYYDFLR